MPKLPKYEVYETRDHNWRWRLLGANGEPVAASESYTRKEDAARGARDARRASFLARIVTP